MKTLKQIREEYDSLTHKQENEERKLSALVDSGLMESKKLSLIKRAMNEDNRVLTPSEKNAVMHLLESLIDNVVSEELRPATTRMSDMPSILVLKRKAIRVYPGGQNVGLYYSQQIDRYVAVPFDKNRADTKGVLNMMEEEQLDEISNKLATKVYSRRKAQADNEDETDVNRKLAAYKAGKTFVSRMAKTGPAAAIKMDDKAKRFSSRVQSMRKAKKAKEAANAPVPEPKPVEPKKPYVDMNVMKGSAATDALRYGKAYHVIGGIGYRIMNKNKVPKQVAEETLDENALARIGTALATQAPKAGRFLKNLFKGKKAPAGGKKPPTKADRLKNLDKNRQRNRNNRRRDALDTADDVADAANSKTDNNQGTVQPNDTKPAIGIATRVSPTGTGSKHAITVRKNVFDMDRNTRYNKSIGGAQPQRQAPGMMENVEVDLDGNKFELNSIVAKKVHTVYESLNKKNKKKMVDMMNESEESFNKVISFVVRH